MTIGSRLGAPERPAGGGSAPQPPEPGASGAARPAASWLAIAPRVGDVLEVGPVVGPLEGPNEGRRAVVAWSSGTGPYDEFVWVTDAGDCGRRQNLSAGWRPHPTAAISERKAWVVVVETAAGARVFGPDDSRATVERFRAWADVYDEQRRHPPSSTLPPEERIYRITIGELITPDGQVRPLPSPPTRNGR